MVGASIYAQRNHVVTLENGSEIRGKLLDTDANSTKLKTKDGSIWSFATNEIASIDKFQPRVSGKGVFLRAEVGLLGGSQLSPSVQIINGFSFDSHWDLGLGIGWEQYWWDHYIPISANMRYNILNNHFTPFVDVMAGYVMPMGNFDSNKGGFSSGAKIGFTKHLSDRFSFSTSAGYRFAVLQENNPWWDDFITIREIHRFELKFGLTFK